MRGALRETRRRGQNVIAMTETGSAESRPEIRLTTAAVVRRTEIAVSTGTEVIKYVCPLYLTFKQESLKNI